MTLAYGTKLGLLVDGVPGEDHYNALMAQWRGFDALIQPTVKSRVAALPTTGQVEGDLYLLTATANVNKIARWTTKLNTPGWEYYTPTDGWYVWSTFDQKGYRYKLISGALAWGEETTGGGGAGGGTVVSVSPVSGVLDLSAVVADTVIVTLTSNVTSVVLPAGAAGARKDLLIRFTQNSTGGWTVATSGITWDSGVAQTVNGVANASTYFMLSNIDNSGWVGFSGPSNASVAGLTESFQISLSDMSTAIVAGTNKGYMSLPYAYKLTGVVLTLLTPQATGSIFTVNVKANGTTIFSTKLTVDNTEDTSVTAATPFVFTTPTPSYAAGTKLTVDVDQVGDGSARGAIVTVLGVKA